LLRQEVRRSVVASAGALLMRGAIDAARRAVDYEEIGGAPLLGVAGCGVIAHGRSTAKAILNALSQADSVARLALDRELSEAALRGLRLV
jgi:glycerol-3-phosphate acyltransferase PlsX